MSESPRSAVEALIAQWRAQALVFIQMKRAGGEAVADMLEHCADELAALLTAEAGVPPPSHEAISLARSLPDEMIEAIRAEWGNTNVAVIKHWRDLVLAAGVPADPPVSAAEPTCRVCGKRDKAHGNETHAYDPDGTVRDMVRDFEDGNR